MWKLGGQLLNGAIEPCEGFVVRAVRGVAFGFERRQVVGMGHRLGA
jgi:hypothetical protein